MQRWVGLPAIAGMLLVGCSSGAVGGGGGTGGDRGGEAGLACAGIDDCEQWFGPAPCGAWGCAGGICQVECADCTDPDKDGYGPDPACAGPDCDETDGTFAGQGGDGDRDCGTAGAAGRVLIEAPG